MIEYNGDDQAIVRLLKAHARVLSRELREASEDEPRAFLIITAPASAVGHCFCVGNLAEQDINRFLAMAVKHSDRDPSVEHFSV